MPRKRRSKAALRKSKLKQKSRSKWYHIKKTYGLTQEQWCQIYDDQKGRCFICQRTEEQIRKGRMKYLSVDHCHDTGKIRGLLCGHCNHNILPTFEKHPAMAGRINTYLNRQEHYGIVPEFQEGSIENTPSNT